LSVDLVGRWRVHRGRLLAGLRFLGSRPGSSTLHRFILHFLLSKPGLSRSIGLRLCLLFGTFFHPHPPIGRFVANKRQTAIQPIDDRTVEAVFSPAFGLKSRSFFSVGSSAIFTL